MAAGDEKIDVFDQVLIKNRLTDSPVEIMFAGINYIWAAGETRSIPKAYANHFMNRSTFHWDPTEQNYPKRTLVCLKADKTPVDADADLSDITLADTKVLDLIDDEHLPDRYFDDKTGEPLRHKEGRRTGIDPKHFRGRGVNAEPKLHKADPSLGREVSEALAPLAEPTQD